MLATRLVGTTIVLIYLLATVLCSEPSSKNQAERSYLVLGSANNIKAANLAVFVLSWRRFSPMTKVVLFIAEWQPFMELLNMYAEFIIVPTSDQYIWHNYRFMLCKDYLAANASHYDMVVVTDVRDVAVQSNPWVHPLAEKAYREQAVVLSRELVGPAKHYVKYKHNSVNAKWLRDCVGDEEFVRCVADSDILCVGVTLGYGPAMLQYLEVFSQMAAQFGKNGVCTGRFLGLDSAANAYMAYCMDPSVVPPLIIAQAQDSFVNTLGPSFPHWHNEFGDIVSMYGHVSPIIHQYDRSVALTSALFNKYFFNPFAALQQDKQLDPHALHRFMFHFDWNV